MPGCNSFSLDSLYNNNPNVHHQNPYITVTVFIMGSDSLSEGVSACISFNLDVLMLRAAEWVLAQSQAADSAL